VLLDPYWGAVETIAETVKVNVVVFDTRLFFE
jgi:hypothetical protein